MRHYANTMWRYNFNQTGLKLIIIAFSVIILSSSCSTNRNIPKQSVSQYFDYVLDTSTILNSGFAGLAFYDMESGKYIYRKNADKYFVPASNVKLFTLYTCIKSLGDSLPALKYIETDTSFTFWGTGDPSFLHPYFSPSATLPFLRSKAIAKKIYYAHGHNFMESYGSGWMWDDYNGYYQPELSPIPMFGNIVHAVKDSTGLNIYPISQEFHFQTDSTLKRLDRKFEKNEFSLPLISEKSLDFDQEIPYKHATDVNLKILEDSLGVPIFKTSIPLTQQVQTLYSLPVDTVYRRMMQISDNMLAEHLLLISSVETSDTFSSEVMISKMNKSYYADFSQPVNLVDGSGLSRYNLVTPQAIIELLQKMSTDIPEQRLYSLLAQGGQFGTLGKMFLNDKTTFVFGKSGSMAGVYNLSGFFISKSGKKYAFSFMNNNFNTSVSSVRKEVEKILTGLREKL